MRHRSERVARYREQVQNANNEQAKKERLLLLLRDLYDQDVEASDQIDRLALGSERWVTDIKLKDRIKTGRADTVAGTTIIEFENDLRRTGDHAVDQLKEYVYGEWQRGQRGPFTLVATDCLTWRVYAPHYLQLEDGVESAHDLDLKLTDELAVGEGNADDVYFFLDRYLFATEPVRPTLDGLKRDFGETSGVFLRALDALQGHFETAREDGAVQVAFDQWRKTLAIAYGETFEGDAREFLVHTYLSVLSKVLAYEVLTGDDFIDDGELKGLLTGTVFDKYNVHNFVEQDFFAWVAEDAHLEALRPAFRAVAQQVGRYDFSDVGEDVMKGVYQELIDLDTRHALGEYYTPDWLCERVVAELPFERHTRVLDPACGSGSFLRAAVARLRREHPDLTPRDLAEQVVGIELHPLSVQIAKTTLLLALGPAVRRERQKIRLQVYLANTLYLPTGAVGLFGERFTTTIDGARHELSTTVLQDPLLFDTAVAVADELAGRAQAGQTVTPDTLAAVTRQRGHALPENTRADFWTLFEALRDAKAAGRDSIWRFILQNTYKPFFLREQFDVVVGNPPWLTYSQITVADYQDEVAELAGTYGVLPRKAANRPHLEIAGVFLSHAARMFLKPRGTVAFVLPRSFLSADHHQAWRSGRADFVRLQEIWDLDGVGNLFPVPSCVLFGERAHAARKPPAAGLPGYTVHGRLREHNATWEEADDRLRFEPVTWYVGHLGNRTAFTTRKPRRGRKVNAYKDGFRQGATIVPRNLYFVEVTQDVPDLDDRSVAVRTDPEVAKLAKPPWKAHTLAGRVDSRFLYRTAQAKSLLPFVCVDPSLVVLPVFSDEAANLPLAAPADLLDAGFLDTADWFTDAEKVWERHKTQRAKKKGMTFLDRLDYSRGITNQSLATPYLVLYSTSAKDANACVVEHGAFDRPFVADHVSYWFGTDDRDEADYLAAFLNAETPNRLIKDFQARGLFGARHVHKTILDVPLPAYDASVARHRRVAELGRQCAARADAWAAGLPADDRARLGTLRLELRAHLAEELDAIDAELDALI